MHISFFLLAASALDVVSAGLVSKRAAFGVGALVTELSTVDGRDFCQAYVGAEVYTLPKMATESYTSTIYKQFTTRTTTTSQETIGTLRKGTTTIMEVQNSTIWTTTTAFAYTEWLTDTTTPVVTVSATSTITLPYSSTGIYDPIRRRQAEALPTPEAITDSDPFSISAACTRVLNRFPVYTTSEATTTKTFTTTSSNTTTQVMTKTQKVTHIIPYATVTQSTTVTVGPFTKWELIEGVETKTTVETAPTSTETIAAATVEVGICAEASLPQPTMIGGVTSVQNNFQYGIDVHHFYGTVTECCEFCQSMKYRGAGCLGYGVSGFHINTPGAVLSCTVSYRRFTNGFDPVCPVSKIGYYWDDSRGADGRPTAQRPGPCLEKAYGCDVANPNICFTRWAPEFTSK